MNDRLIQLHSGDFVRARCIDMIVCFDAGDDIRARAVVRCGEIGVICYFCSLAQAREYAKTLADEINSA